MTRHYEHRGVAQTHDLERPFSRTIQGVLIDCPVLDASSVTEVCAGC